MRERRIGPRNKVLEDYARSVENIHVFSEELRTQKPRLVENAMTYEGELRPRSYQEPRDMQRALLKDLYQINNFIIAPENADSANLFEVISSAAL